MYNVLMVAWARFMPVKKKEVDDRMTIFEFESEKDNKQIMDLSLWSIHDHCLNLKECRADMSMDEIPFDRMHFWIQIFGSGMS